MIVEYIRYELKDHAPDALIEAYSTAAEHLKAAEECLGFDLAECSENPSTFVLRILWRSAEAHMEGFRKSRNFPPFLAAVRPFIGEIAEMRHYEPTNVAWAPETS